MPTPYCYHSRAARRTDPLRPPAPAGESVQRNRGNSTIKPTMPRILTLSAGLMMASGCLWIPGYPPDKADPRPDPSDPPGSSHCSPHAGGSWNSAPSRPVLLDPKTGLRNFRCRITAPDRVTWTLRPVGLNGRQDYIIAEGVEAVTLHSDGLPLAPQPYRAELELAVRAGGNQQITTWPLVVLPYGDDFFLPAEIPEEPLDRDEAGPQEPATDRGEP